MAHLLGSEYCIESLRSDVIDIQTTILDVVSRVGHVPGMSWKFPDKLSCDLDIPNILNQYEYSTEDTISNQVAHIILLELVIDRFSFLIQSMTRFTDTLTHGSEVSPSISPGDNATANLSTSLGLNAKKHWNRMSQLSFFLSQIQNNLRHYKCKCKEKKESEQERNFRESQSGITVARQTSTLPKSVSTVLNGPCDVRATQSTVNPILDVGYKSIQTSETSFKPCQSCHVAHKCLKDVCRTVTSLCHQESLPSNINKYLTDVGGLEDDWLSDSDLGRWRSELQKDLTRLGKHFNKLVEDKKQLSEKLDNSQTDCRKLTKKISCFDQEKNKETQRQATLIAQAESRTRKITSELTAEKRLHGETTEALEELRIARNNEVTELKSEIARQQELLSILDRLDKLMTDEVVSSPRSPANLEKRTSLLQSHLSVVKADLKDKEEKIKQETSRADNLAKQIQTQQSKYEKLVMRLEELTRHNEDLQEQMNDIEDSNDNFRVKCQNTEKEKLELEMEIQEQKVLVRTLEEARTSLFSSVREMKERIMHLEEEVKNAKEERQLLVEYPDLNGPVNPNYQGSENVAVDMAKQVDANATRIRLLEDQNRNLLITLAKMNPSGDPLASTTLNVDDHRRRDEVEDDKLIRGSSRFEDQGLNKITLFQLPNTQEQNETIYGSERISFNSTIAAPTLNAQVVPTQLWDLTPALPGAPHFGCDSYQSVTNDRPPNDCRGHSSDASVRSYNRVKSSGVLEQVTNDMASARSRPTSAIRPSSQQLPKRNNNPLMKWSSGNSAVRREIVHACQMCGKMFKRKEDLDIHKAYCSARKH